jgi:hypothetical protein
MAHVTAKLPGRRSPTRSKVNVATLAIATPAFVWRAVIADDHNPDFPKRVVTYACFGAAACPGIPCNPNAQWVLINDDVRLTGSFFLP